MACSWPLPWSFGPSVAPVEFCDFDERLNRAARRERLVVSDV